MKPTRVCELSLILALFQFGVIFSLTRIADVNLFGRLMRVALMRKCDILTRFDRSARRD